MSLVLRAATLAASCALFAVACENDASRIDKATIPSAAPRARVVTAHVKEGPVGKAEDVCDVIPSDKPALKLPQLAAEAEPPPLEGRTWLNLWATWCKPCVDELPMLKRWKAKMRQSGVELSLLFISADQSDAAINSFRKKTQAEVGALRIADPQMVPSWLAEVGLDEGAPLPIHVLTDSSGRVICMRSGAVTEEDYEPLLTLLRQ